MIPTGANIVTVSELTSAIKGVLEVGFASVWVVGEISNLSRPSSGHLYFSLKDSQAQIRAVIWRSTALRMRFELRNGMEVIACGRVSVYAVRGEYQIAVEEVHPKGVGALDLALQQLKEKLQVKGYFDPRRKRPLPPFPARIAIVTSPTGAAIRDMVQRLTERWPAAEIVIVPVRVQGDGAAAEIAAAIQTVNQLTLSRRLPFDAMIVGRGGGSLEDLWAFNEEAVADAIFASCVPVVSAVGHETDVVISDLVADQRASTPTHAATQVVPDRCDVLNELAGFRAQLRDGLTRTLELATQRLDGLASRRPFRSPLDRVRDLERRLDDWSERLRRAGGHGLERATAALQTVAGRLATLSPLQVLTRGYSVTLTPSGVVIRDASAVHAGDTVVTRLNHGRFTSRVEDVDNA